jgi:V-type H+-transporting ATPase subunit a
MKHGTLVIPTERARHFLDLIGRNANMQFEDMNAQDMRRPYKKYVQRIDEMERILRFLFDELAKIEGSKVVTNRNDNFLENDHQFKLDAVETELKQLYVQFMKFKENNADLGEQKNAAIEEKYVMQMATMALAMYDARQASRGEVQHGGNAEFQFAATQPLLGEGEEGMHRDGMMFNNIAGVIAQADQDRFARTVFRATRGNTFTHFQQIPEVLKDPKTGKEIAKSVFVVYYQDSRVGGQSSAMGEKIKKLCAAFGVSQHRWPANREEAEQRKESLSQTLQEKAQAIEAYERYVRSEAAVMLQLARPDGNSLIEEWRLFCVKEKAIYSTLNCFEGDITLRATCWYPANEEAHIRQLLIRQSNQQQTNGMLVSDRTQTKKNAPTYIRTNALTGMCQDLVNTYGVPRYQEANAALLTTITFPFLFGVMYGDVGHGSMIMIAGLFLIWNAAAFKYTQPELYKARYMIFMMGFFGTYAGFMYNDFFCLGMDIFGTRWTQVHGPDPKSHYFEPTYDIKNNGGPGPYPFGLDPTWHGASNELLFVNSLKMKISVLLGVAQMTVGVFLRFGNAVHERNWTDFVFECIPMLLFMTCFFGYMDFMIMYKWVTPMDNPPSIINSLIVMAMGGVDPAPLYPAAPMVQSVLFAITVATVPIMLLPKPLILWYQAKQSAPQGHQAIPDEEQAVGGGAQGGHGGGHAGGGHGKKHEEEEEHFEFGEVMIHQIIETIEYVLGTVSHTASYLRLWALSLAHQQLSLVFFQKTIMAGMMMSFPMNGVVLYFMFMAWFGITCGVLLGMDVLECFLHTLRLHWVEFQSKFYRADGYIFAPYRHDQVLKPQAAS